MKRAVILPLIVLSVCSCRKEEILWQSETENKGDTVKNEIIGFYLLNEGNMGSNKATLDYYDYSTGVYHRNIYSERNPDRVQSLGDVGNDLKIYGNRLYAVINCSNLVEVMTADSAKHIGTIECPNCRYLRFKDGYGYLTSYAGPVLIDQDYKQKGYVAKFDTATLEIIDTCHVGFQPDELEIVGNRLYVANSGGYMVPNYENTVSVIDIATMQEVKRIEVVNNLHHLRVDGHNQLWVTSRGDYYNQPSRLYCIDILTETLIDSVDVAVSNLWLDGDSLYVYGTEWSYVNMDNTITYSIVNVLTHEVVNRQFITDSEVLITIPYGIMVHPVTKDIYVTDAKNYVSPGVLWSLDHNGKKKWTVRTGDIPAQFALLYK
ncbi:MAG: YncE family protein [Paludibacteraceae bacterium]|nr:YncE family protein [Paludibacteraceae bacterium]